jgi:hypothetical protein
MNEKFELGAEQKEGLLIEFQKEIQSIKEEAETTGGPVHLREVNVLELTLEDREIWEKVKSGSVTREDFLHYRPQLTSNVSHSRKEFSGFIANKMIPVINRLRLEQGEPSEE